MIKRKILANQTQLLTVLLLAFSFFVLLISRLSSPISEFSDGYDYLYNGQNLLRLASAVPAGLPDQVSVGVFASKGYFMPSPFFSMLSAQLYSVFNDSFIPLSIFSFVLVLVALFFTFLIAKKLSGSPLLAGVVVFIISLSPLIQKNCIRPTGDSILFCAVQIFLWMLIQRYPFFYSGIFLGFVYFFRTHTLLFLFLTPIFLFDKDSLKSSIKNTLKLFGGFVAVYAFVAILLKILSPVSPGTNDSTDNSLHFYYTTFRDYFSQVNKSYYLDTLIRTFDETFSWKLLSPLAVLGFLPALFKKNSDQTGVHLQNMSLFAWIGISFQILLMGMHYNVEHRYYIYYLPALIIVAVVILKQSIDKEIWPKKASLVGVLIIVGLMGLELVPVYRKLRFEIRPQQILANLKNSDLSCRKLSEYGLRSDGAILSNNRFLGRCLGFQKNYPIPGNVSLNDFLAADNSQVSAFSMVIPNHPLTEMDDWQKLVVSQESFTDQHGVRFARKIFETRPGMIFALFLKESN